jgi:hypothetical protein
MNTRDLVIGDLQFCMYKGDPGTGKSRAAGSFPEPFFFDIDGRMRPLALAYPDKAIQYESFFNDFAGMMRKLGEFLNYSPYGTYVIDSLTSFSRTTMSHMIKARVKDSGDTKRRLQRGGLDVSQLEDYGGETAAITQLLDAMRELNKKAHVILIAHCVDVVERNIQQGTTIMTRQLLTGGKKIAAEIPAYFDETYHFYSRPDLSGGNPDYYVSTSAAGIDWAKTALPLPPEIHWSHQNFYDILTSLVAKAKTP